MANGIHTITSLFRHRVMILAAIVAFVGTLTAVPTPVTQTAQAATFPGWYMLVSHYYDGSGQRGPGAMRCLSANGETSPSGGGTHLVYLVPCNPGAQGQWWRVLNSGFSGQLRNRLEFGDGTTWCLSRNYTQPPGGFPNTAGVYTSPCRTGVEGQIWQGVWYTEFIKGLRSSGDNPSNDQWSMSTTATAPYANLGYRVFTVRTPNDPPPEVHQWRPYQPQNGPFG